MSHAVVVYGPGPASKVTKRDFLQFVTGTAGTASFAWPLADSASLARNAPLGSPRDGWFRPRHGGQYDMSGRARRGPAIPAAPGHAFDFDSKIRIG